MQFLSTIARGASTPTLHLALAAAVLAGCGAKTGLEVPDAGPLNESDGGTPVAPTDDTCVEIPFEGGPVDLPLDTVARVSRADVLFLVDVTESMRDEIGRIQERLRETLSPGIDASIGDTQLGVATFADFPVGDYGEGRDRPFSLLRPMTSDVAAIQAGVNSIVLGAGKDEPESQVEALYQVATGDGIEPWVPASFGCPSGGFGYPCFREDAVPVVLLFTDAPFHNGPGGAFPYAANVRGARTYDETVRALRAQGIRVIGLNSSDDRIPREHLRAIARDTGAVDRDDRPIVFDIGVDGAGLGSSVIGAVRTFAQDVIQDIDLELIDPDPRDGVDPRDFVDAIVPLSVDPPDGAESIDVEAGVFRGVRGGTSVVFRLTIRNDAVVPGPEPQAFELDVVFRGDGRTRLARRTVVLVIPGADGEGCESVAAPSP